MSKVSLIPTPLAMREWKHGKDGLVPVTRGKVLQLERREKLSERSKRSFAWTDPDGPAAA